MATHFFPNNHDILRHKIWKKRKLTWLPTRLPWPSLWVRDLDVKFQMSKDLGKCQPVFTDHLRMDDLIYNIFDFWTWELSGKCAHRYLYLFIFVFIFRIQNGSGPAATEIHFASWAKNDFCVYCCKIIRYLWENLSASKSSCPPHLIKAEILKQ